MDFFTDTIVNVLCESLWRLAIILATIAIQNNKKDRHEDKNAEKTEK